MKGNLLRKSKTLLRFDWYIFIPVLILSIIGIINIYSSTYQGEPRLSPLYIRQIYWIITGIILMVIVLSFNYNLIAQFGYVIYGFTLSLLILNLLVGKVYSGAQRWLSLGWFSIQPSEFVKLGLIIALVRYFQDRQLKNYELKDLLIPFILTGIPVIITIEQPDLGTAISLLLLSFSIIIFANIRLSSLFILLTVAASSLPLFWNFLREYQRKRILSFISPELDPLGTGYHLIQSKIAIGSGKIFGKGFLKGTQGQLNFLPSQQTDFIFSVLAEEWGFIGIIVVLSLFLFLLFNGITVGSKAKEKFGAYLVFGIVSLFFWHIFINIGMVVGFLPVVGVPLPFLSYGGSSVITFLIGTGLMMNVSLRG